MIIAFLWLELCAPRDQTHGRGITSLVGSILAFNLNDVNKGSDRKKVNMRLSFVGGGGGGGKIKPHSSMDTFRACEASG